jgi:hypothetical protein
MRGVPGTIFAIGHSTRSLESFISLPQAYRVTMLVRGYGVEEITGLMSSRRHILTNWATVDGIKITYAPGSPELKKDDETRSHTLASPQGKRHALPTRRERVERKVAASKE